MRKKRKQNQESLKNQFSKLLEVPPEVISNFPQIILTGNKEIKIENFGGLLEYSDQIMKLSTKCGILVIRGMQLEAQKMTADFITIKGKIQQVEFLS